MNGASQVDLEGHSEKAIKKKSAVSQVEVRLQEEFKAMMAKLGVQNLKLVWVPDLGKGLSGEVRNNVVYIYEKDEVEAIETLKHELIDYLVTSKIVKPLVDLVNLLIKSRESDVYREKETIVEVLSKMLS